MTTALDTPGDARGPAGGGTAPPPARRRAAGAWRLSPRGVRTVAVLELRQRVRSSRWVVVLAVWVAVVAGITALARLALGDAGSTGPVLFSGVVFLVLSMGLLVAPSLSATTLNGDRAGGTLAVLQVTLLSAVDIAVGKLLAAWATAMVLLAASSPFLVYALTLGGSGTVGDRVARALVTLALLAVVLLVVCAVALGFSALCARTAASAVLTYVTVAFLAVGLPVVFGLSTVLAVEDEQVRVREPVSYDDTTGAPIGCRETVQRQPVVHSERTYWLLAASPYVVVADAAPRAPVGDGFTVDPLGLIREGARTAKAGPELEQDYCTDLSDEAAFAESERERLGRLDAVGAVWPVGLAANLLLGAAGLVVAVRRLGVPIGELARGTRVA